MYYYDSNKEKKLVGAVSHKRRKNIEKFLQLKNIDQFYTLFKTK